MQKSYRRERDNIYFIYIYIYIIHSMGSRRRTIRIQAWRLTVSLILGVIQVACCAQRVPRARVCPLDALTLMHAYARTRATPTKRRARAHCLPRACLTHTMPILQRRNRLSGHCGALRVVHVEISRARYRNNFKSRPSHRALTCAYARVCQHSRRTRASDTDLMSRISESCFMVHRREL